MADRNQSRPQTAEDHYTDGFGRQTQGAHESDPLAELARLIGQNAPQSNLAQDHQRGRQQNSSADFAAGAPSWLQAAQANLHPEPRHEHDVRRHGQLESEPILTPMPSFLRGTREDQAPSRYDDLLYSQQAHGQYQEQDQYQEEGAYPQDHYPDQDHYQDEGQFDDAPGFLSQEPRRSRRGGMLTVGVVLGLAVVGTASAYAYRSYVGSPRSGTPPVIKAETSPTRVVPPAAQSADGAGKLIYDRIANAGGPERVVSREEQPVDVNATAAARSVFPPPPRQSTASSGQPPVTANGAPASDEPRKVRTVTVRTDQPVSPQGSPASKPVAPPAAIVARPAPSPGGSAPMALAPTNIQSASAAPAASVSPSRGGYVVQIASQKSEAEAQASYRAAQAKYGNILGSRSPTIKRADLGEKGVYYRAMVGPFASQDEASQLCSNLKIAGGQCVVQRN